MNSLATQPLDLAPNQQFNVVWEEPGSTPLAEKMKLGQNALVQGFVREAMRQFAEAVELDPDNISARYALGVAFAAMGRNQESIEVLQDLQAAHPESLLGRSGVAILCARADQTDRAQILLRGIKRQDSYTVAEFSALCNAHIVVLVTSHEIEMAVEWCETWLSFEDSEPAAEPFRPESVDALMQHIDSDSFEAVPDAPDIS